MKKHGCTFNSIDVLNDTVMFILLGASLIIGGATNTINAAIVCGLTLSTLLITLVIAYSLRNHYNGMIPVIVINIGVASVIDLLAHAFVPDTYNVAGVYVGILATSILVIRICKSALKEESLGSALNKTLKAFVPYLVAFIFVGLVREVLGSASFLGNEIAFLKDYKISTLNNEIGGFLLLGFAMAILNKKEAK